jgi:hypothetical protein
MARTNQHSVHPHSGQQLPDGRSLQPQYDQQGDGVTQHISPFDRLTNSCDWVYTPDRRMAGAKPQAPGKRDAGSHPCRQPRWIDGHRTWKWGFQIVPDIAAPLWNRSVRGREGRPLLSQLRASTGAEAFAAGKDAIEEKIVGEDFPACQWNQIKSGECERSQCWLPDDSPLEPRKNRARLGRGFEFCEREALEATR